MQHNNIDAQCNVSDMSFILNLFKELNITKFIDVIGKIITKLKLCGNSDMLTRKLVSFYSPRVLFNIIIGANNKLKLIACIYNSIINKHSELYHFSVENKVDVIARSQKLS